MDIGEDFREISQVRPIDQENALNSNGMECAFIVVENNLSFMFCT